MRMFGAFEKQQLKACEERKSSLVTSNILPQSISKSHLTEIHEGCPALVRRG